MSASTCSFCKQEQPIVKTVQTNNYPYNYQFSLPSSSDLLFVSDKTRNREYMYGINYCPVCGRKVS